MKLKLGKYKHYKGELYEIICLAKHSETLEELVVYRTLYNNKKSRFWVRPLSMFVEKVEVDGKGIPRFKYIGRMEK